MNNFKKPTTLYTKSESINIAYQVFGEGDIDLVYIPGWVSNIDWMWECPDLVEFLQELGKIARVILFDKRGTGLSDRVVELSTLEERMDDIRAVMDAVNSQRAVLFGHSEGGCASALFAATYPNRVISLISFGIFAKRRYSPDYPWAPTDEERQKVYDMIERDWGNGNMGLESLAPSRADDSEFMDWLANYFRSGASPSAAMVLTKMNTQVDIINILSAIKVPALVMQRTHDIDVKIEEGRFIADRIDGATFVELDGNDHLFWVGETTEILNRMRTFILDKKPNVVHEKQLLTIVVAKVIATEQASEDHREAVSNVVGRYRGKLIQNGGLSLIATFEGPSKAVHCSMDLIDVMKHINVQLAVGIHIQEVDMNQTKFVSGETKEFTNSILENAQPDQILITQTVKFLLSGTGFKFIRQKSVFETSDGDLLPWFAVNDPAHINANTGNLQQQMPQNDSFFTTVMQCIDEHLNDETFGVETLCKHIGTSERQLQRKLKATTNKSPNQLISSVRLHRAKELIHTETYNMAEIAFQVGFSSPSYFSKKFKKEFGVCPSLMLEEKS